MDGLTFTPATQTVLRCSDPSIPTDSRNLVMRAVELLQSASCSLRTAGANVLPVAIDLKKNVPHGGGLGGGSSDAAFTLSSLNEFWKLGLTREQLRTLAAQLGSDIPFFLFGPSSICRGRGERVEPIARPKPKAIVLILPGTTLPTPAVYRTFDELQLGNDADLANEPSWQQWTTLSAVPLLAGLVNDLEPAAFHLQPSLGKLRADIEQTIGQPVRMSGSGSSLFTIVDEMENASTLASLIQSSFSIDARAVQLCA